jgi:hypothetical protein
VPKQFEITYNPNQWDAPPGGIAQAWSTPYGGLNTQTPENIIGPQYSPSMNNFMLRNAELRSRPAFRRYLPGPDGNNVILGLTSFLSKNSVWHTCAFTINGMFQLQFNPTQQAANGINPWTRVGGPALSSGNYVRTRVFQSILYYTNGSGHLSAWDGAALTPINDAAFLGTGTSGLPPATTTLLGGLYLGELDSHIIMAYTTEIPVTSGVQGAMSTFPQRLRWSNNGFNPYDANGNFGLNLGTAGATFDPNVFLNAGLNDFLDVPDAITGLMFIGMTGFIFRQNGITEISPTGNGNAPFDFNHLWASENGIGNVYPATIAQYGGIGVFVANDNIYQVNGTQVVAIGGGARDAILSDLANTFQAPTAVISFAYTLGYTYLVYKLFVSLPNGATRVWVYSLEDGNWSPWTITNSIVGIPNKCWIGASPLTVTTLVGPSVPVGGTGGGGGNQNKGGGGGGTGGGGGQQRR